MIIETGLFALILALFCSLAQLLTYNIAIKKNNHNMFSFVKSYGYSCLLLVSYSFIVLCLAFINNDFSVNLVYSTSNSSLSLLGKLNAFLSTKEGFLFIFLLAGSYLKLKLFSDKDYKHGVKYKAWIYQCLINVSSLVILLFFNKPFTRNNNIFTEGTGLNDIFIANPIFPIAIACYSIIFAITLAAVVERRVTPLYANKLKVRAKNAFILALLSIFLFMFNSYHFTKSNVLWNWDIIENTNLVLLIIGANIIISISVLAKEDAIRRWTVFQCFLPLIVFAISSSFVFSGKIPSIYFDFYTNSADVILLWIVNFIITFSILFVYVKKSKFINKQNKNYLSVYTKEGKLFIISIALMFLTILLEIFSILPGVYNIFGDGIKMDNSFYEYLILLLLFSNIVIVFLLKSMSSFTRKILFLGVAIFVAGFSLSKIYTQEIKIKFYPNKEYHVSKNISLKSRNAEIIETEKYNAIETKFFLLKDKKIISEFNPIKKMYFSPVHSKTLSYKYIDGLTEINGKISPRDNLDNLNVLITLKKYSYLIWIGFYLILFGLLKLFYLDKSKE
jgi:cytochrome c biogenesis factor